MALHHVASGEVVDLDGAARAAEASRSVALVKTRAFEAIRLVIAAGGELQPHHVTGEFTLQCLSGCVILSLPERELRLSGGQWVYVGAGVPHSVRAIDDSVLLLTIILVPGR